MSASGGKQTPKNRTYTVEDIAAILGIGKSSAYKLANSCLLYTSLPPPVQKIALTVMFHRGLTHSLFCITLN